MGISLDYYQNLVKGWKKKKVLVLGDAMIDEYIFGTVNRISPEAPVAVVCAKKYATHLGGACNVAKNIKALNGEPILFSFVGEDSYSQVLQKLLKEEGIENYLYSIPNFPTTCKTRIVADRQHIVRVDREEVFSVEKSIIQKMMDTLYLVAQDVDIVIYSDYAKGFFTKEMIEELDKLWAQMDIMPKILVDPKVSNISLFRKVYLLTPNSKETEESTGIAIDTNEGLQAAANSLFTTCECDNVLTTLGARGMALFTDEKTMQYIPVIAQEVYDVTGAGDAVIATVAFALANNSSLYDAVWLANCAGGYSVRHLGVVSVTRANIIDIIQEAFSS